MGFLVSRERGERFENWVARWFPGCTRITSQEGQLRKGDIRWRGLNIEVKADRIDKKWTGNLFFETWSNQPRGTRGWMDHLDYCDLLIFGFNVPRHRFFAVPFMEAREWVRANKGRWDEKQQQSNDQPNETHGLCVPISEIMAHNLCFELPADCGCTEGKTCYS